MIAICFSAFLRYELMFNYRVIGHSLCVSGFNCVLHLLRITNKRGKHRGYQLLNKRGFVSKCVIVVRVVAYA